MPVNFSDLELAFDFVSNGGSFGTHEAFVCRKTGKIYWRSEGSDLDELEDLPDDIDDETKYARIPDKHDFDLGKPLVLNFAREFLPGDFDEVRYIFSRRGAYQKFKSLLVRRKALDQWFKYEAEATERALRDWCEVTGIEIADQAAPNQTSS
jgi:hypothetical protein